jgi:hexokinase
MARPVRESFLESLEDQFDFSAGTMKDMVKAFHQEMEQGLAGKASSLRMLPAFVDCASGKEKGRFIALDFGGTNFRVLQVKLERGKAALEHSSKYVIPGAVVRGTGEQLFNFIAQSMKRFLDENQIELSDKRKLGFTFSFPMKQSSIATGILINWTKGFSATGVVGSNVVDLLDAALARYGLNNIDISALANDTVGTLAAKSYEDPASDVGIIFGTGTNACYREKRSRIKGVKTPYRGDYMIINTEWGNFDRLPMNDYDGKLDKATNNPGKQRMEKMISGMYLGEIARLVLSDMIKKKCLFSDGKVKFSRGSFKTRHMSLIESDESKGLMKIEGYLEGIGIVDTTLLERETLKNACRLVSRRAARISAAAISSVVTWMDPKLKKDHSIAIDGTLYEKYPRFRRSILQALKELHGDVSKRIKLTQAKDGSGIGVAIVAAVAASKK